MKVIKIVFYAFVLLGFTVTEAQITDLNSKDPEKQTGYDYGMNTYNIYSKGYSTKPDIYNTDINNGGGNKPNQTPWLGYYQLLAHTGENFTFKDLKENEYSIPAFYDITGQHTIELVSFPFIPHPEYTANTNHTKRIFVVPEDCHFISPNNFPNAAELKHVIPQYGYDFNGLEMANSGWSMNGEYFSTLNDYTPVCGNLIIPKTLWNKYTQDVNDPAAGAKSGWVQPSSLVSVLTAYENFQKFHDPMTPQSQLLGLYQEIKNNNVTGNLFPHSVLQHKLWHANPESYVNGGAGKDYVDSVMFVFDHTRGKSNEYPFISENFTSGNPTYLEGVLCYNIKAEQYSTLHYLKPNHNKNYFVAISNIWNNNKKGFEFPDMNFYWDNTLKFNDITKLSYPGRAVVRSNLYSNANLAVGSLDHIGFKSNGTEMFGLPHEYWIDKNINLQLINPWDKVIYNPEVVHVSASDLHFPGCYTFKTIRSQYPELNPLDPKNSIEFAYVKNIYYKYNNRDNGGPYADLRKVPIPTDLSKTEDPCDASVYILESGSKLTLEDGVHVYDATFKLNGGQLIYNPLRINGRFKVVDAGGNLIYRHTSSRFQVQSESINPAYFDNVLLPDNGSNTQVLKTETYYAPKIEVAGNNQDVEIQGSAHVVMVGGEKIHLKPGFKTSGKTYFHAYFGKKSGVYCSKTGNRGANNSNESSQNIEKNDNEWQLTLFPNPTKDKFSLKTMNTISEDLQVDVYSSLGKKVHTELIKSTFWRNGAYEINLYGMAKGLYIVKVSAADQVKSFKLFKI